MPNWPGTSYPLPDVYFSPLGEGWKVSICLQVGSNTFRWLHSDIVEDRIITLLHDWKADPVWALKRWWGAEPPVQEVKLSAPKTKVLDLSDLTGIKI